MNLLDLATDRVFQNNIMYNVPIAQGDLDLLRTIMLYRESPKDWRHAYKVYTSLDRGVETDESLKYLWQHFESLTDAQLADLAQSCIHELL